jgi:hypothetical protein
MISSFDYWLIRLIRFLPLLRLIRYCTVLSFGSLPAGRLSCAIVVVVLISLSLSLSVWPPRLKWSIHHFCILLYLTTYSRCKCDWVYQKSATDNSKKKTIFDFTVIPTVRIRWWFDFDSRFDWIDWLDSQILSCDASLMIEILDICIIISWTVVVNVTVK